MGFFVVSILIGDIRDIVGNARRSALTYQVSTVLWYSRAVGESENLGVPVLFGGHNLPPLVKIGLTDLPGTTGLLEQFW